ncbi:hypothetical protein GYMLUDRAFT_891506 [Collybiopsis luxurians FD-317 M1]|uniref:Unplaced genomic scaffold GYMLUscaffold_64, whole genome shotgun sequence n=1 Tax=Collybiopsis luxurians FD-317 M1 TaxID=944289 RepID=A0A0D0BJA0_9AGAR|nr:hypothetical protein GYMLUDRAFT_891506 [Collybiopsis luxurians FD-317 M1]
MVKSRLIVIFLVVALPLVATGANLPGFGPCGDGFGACSPGTQCTTGNPSFCLPLSAFENNTTPVVEVTGYGHPIGAVPETAGDDPEYIQVFLGCTDANFAGSCFIESLACDFCFELPAPYQNDLSSIEMLDSRVGCDFWVESDCIGDGINIDSGAIYDLSATNYNDRLVAGTCYLRS